MVSLAIFVAAVPFARTPPERVTAFIPCYELALVITGLITAALLFGQFRITRLTGLLVLGDHESGAVPDQKCQSLRKTSGSMPAWRRIARSVPSSISPGWFGKAV